MQQDIWGEIRTQVGEHSQGSTTHNIADCSTVHWWSEGTSVTYLLYKFDYV